MFGSHQVGSWARIASASAALDSLASSAGFWSSASRRSATNSHTCCWARRLASPVLSQSAKRAVTRSESSTFQFGTGVACLPSR
jgi:hypothetical protein